MIFVGSLTVYHISWRLEQRKNNTKKEETDKVLSEIEQKELDEIERIKRVLEREVKTSSTKN